MVGDPMGHPLLFVALSGSEWLPVAPCGSLWLPVAPCGSLWLPVCGLEPLEPMLFYFAFFDFIFDTRFVAC